MESSSGVFPHGGFLYYRKSYIVPQLSQPCSKMLCVIYTAKMLNGSVKVLKVNCAFLVEKLPTNEFACFISTGRHLQ
jgi:hypothetical protein